MVVSGGSIASGGGEAEARGRGYVGSGNNYN